MPEKTGVSLPRQSKRADRMERAREMRAFGASTGEVAAELGIAPSTVCRWTTPGSRDAMMAWNAANKDKRRAADRNRSQTFRSTCQTCGQPCGAGSGKKGYQRCQGCISAAKDARDAEIVRLYSDGLPVAGIAAALDTTAGSVSVALVALRKRGLIGYRYAAYERNAA